MPFQLLISVAAVFAAAPFMAGLSAAAETSGSHRVSGPITHDNLSIYFIHGASTPGPVPLTLQEAMAKGGVIVHETGSVNQLMIENAGSEDVFVQAGDIVKGGKQDRVLTVSLLVSAGSGKVPIGAFCVEQGRWSARGREDVAKFASAEKVVPSREAKIAMMAPAKPRAETAPVGGRGPEQRTLTQGSSSETGSRQSEVWRNVGLMQNKLAGALSAPVASAQSASSLQLSLENQKLAEARGAYVKALQAAGENGDDIIGYAFAINGRINSADVFASNGLFRKMWPKLLDASATEAIGEKSAKAETPPAPEAVLAFLASAEKGKATASKIDARLMREVRDGDKALYAATIPASGPALHKSYLAK